ncbi:MULTISPECIES: hypothetical protein [Yersinia]|uniref:hypothetical protein n=1 Tax=Yersinia TaxID=629 RepID=UPI0009B713E2|nr:MULTISPECIES: hypothetical protein [Yersinia]ARB84890.1 hypothetical protein A6J67_13315 [Yersinia sp. FDAARGOS_228]AVL34681.1 hypothetical protein CEQ36_02930 [Yersinia intermedia]
MPEADITKTIKYAFKGDVILHAPPDLSPDHFERMPPFTMDALKCVALVSVPFTVTTDRDSYYLFFLIEYSYKTQD